MERIVVVGAGVVGTNTCYQLLKTLPNASVTLIDANTKAAQGTSVQNGGNLPVTQASCWTWKPAKAILKGAFSYNTNQLVYPWQILRNENL